MSLNNYTLYYILVGTIHNKVAYELYEQYIKAADGYCQDEIQEEDDGSWNIFACVEKDEWWVYPHEARYYRVVDRETDKESKIMKSQLKSAKEMIKDVTPNCDDLAASVGTESDMEYDGSDSEDTIEDLYCNEAFE